MGNSSIENGDLANKKSYDRFLCTPYKPNALEILVVVHEAELTGAPILGLNLVTELSNEFNVTVLLLDKRGPLFDGFLASNAHMVYGANLRGNIEAAHQVVMEVIADSNFNLAILNSIESSLHVLPVLSTNGVFCLSLIHEFSSCYVNSKEMWRFMTDWGGEFIFSSQLTRNDAALVAPPVLEERSYIIPQGVCSLPKTGESVDDLAEIDALRYFLRPKKFEDPVTLIIGLGSVHMRKGVDLFIQAASEILKQDPASHYRFIWVGKSYEHDLNWGYNTFLNDQIRRSGLEHKLFLIPDTRYLDVIYEEADFILLTSRLDPLPNIALDAISKGIPLLCFDMASGVAEYLTNYGLGNICVSPYLNTIDMAKKLVEINKSDDHKILIFNAYEKIRNTHFIFKNYCNQLLEVFKNREQIFNSEVKFLSSRNSPAIDKSYFYSKIFLDDFPIYFPRSWDLLDENKAYLFARRYTHVSRKPHAGFHPGIYAEEIGELQGVDPYVHYLFKGAPKGKWAPQIINAADFNENDLFFSHSDVAMHIHVFYVEMLEDILTRVSKNRLCPDLFITTCSNSLSIEISHVLMKFPQFNAEIFIVENRGRDLRPLFKIISPYVTGKYKSIVHVHTKNSPHAKRLLAKDWSDFLLTNIIGDGKTHKMMDLIAVKMLTNPNLGLVFPSDPNIIGWDENRAYAEDIATDLGLVGALPNAIDFPVGSMFWISSAALKDVSEILHDEEYFPPEPLPIDGSNLHAIERLLPLLVGKAGFEYCQTYVEGVTR